MRELELTFGGHDKFVELCALYPTESLSDLELATLREHLETCESCRTLIAEYRHLNRTVIPLVAEEKEQELFSATGWDPQEAKRTLLENLDNPGREMPRADVGTPRAGSVSSARASGFFARLSAPAPILAFVVLIAVAVAAGVSYFAGLRKGTERSAGQAGPSQGMPNGSGVPNLVAQQNVLDTQIKERDAKIESLAAKITEQSNEIARLKELLNQTTADDYEAKSQLSTAQAQQTAIAANRDTLQTQLRDTQSSLGILQGQLRQTLDKRTSDLMQTATLQRKIDELNATVSDKDSQIQEQQTLLSSDRDIRELMGARDLFIADVFDVARDGKTKKPFGRVFYTKNKSLVFYAFDLDKQPDLRGKKDVAFQVWGQNDADKHRPANLGIFYMDNQTNRRWVLKFDDPAVLERINAVFVTVEPSGGSTKPSGRQLLYAYLEAQPNHP